MDVTEKIIQVSKEMETDGTVEALIREKLKKTYADAIENSFRWGELRDALEKKIKTVLVPVIEKKDLTAYATKLDAVLTDIVNTTALPEYKTIVENFRNLAVKDVPKTVTLETIAEKYAAFVASEIDCSGRAVDTESEDRPHYVSGSVMASVEEENTRYHDGYSLLTLRPIYDDDNEDTADLVRRIRLVKYEWENEPGFRINMNGSVDVAGLASLSDFDVYMLSLSSHSSRVLADNGDEAETEFTPDEEPSCDWS